jgi:hypothetical protein
METFLQKYIQGNAVTAITDKQKTVLENIEAKLTEQIAGKTSFTDVIKEYAPQIIDLVNRLAAKFREFSWKKGFSGFIDTFKFVINVAVEVWQILEKISEKVLGAAGFSEGAALEAKIQFGKDLVYYIWKVVDPLTGRFDWIPFKVTLEKWILYKLADFGLRYSYEFFKKNFGIEIMDAKSDIMKAL